MGRANEGANENCSKVCILLQIHLPRMEMDGVRVICLLDNLLSLWLLGRLLDFAFFTVGCRRGRRLFGNASKSADPLILPDLLRFANDLVCSVINNDSESSQSLSVYSIACSIDWHSPFDFS